MDRNKPGQGMKQNREQRMTPCMKPRIEQHGNPDSCAKQSVDQEQDKKAGNC